MYHSIQSSFNRRFRNGFSFGLNYTLGLIEHDATPARGSSTTPTATCSTAPIRLRPTNCSASRTCSATRSRATSCGICPTCDADGAAPHSAVGAGRQRLAAVRRLHRPDRATATRRLQLPERRRQRQHHRLAQLRRPRRDHRRSGLGLLEQSVPAVQHRGLPGAAGRQRRPRVGPELPDRLLRERSGTSPSPATSGWAAAAWSSSASTCSTRSTRSSTRDGKTTMQLTSPTNQTITNPQYDPSGNLVATRLDAQQRRLRRRHGRVQRCARCRRRSGSSSKRGSIETRRESRGSITDNAV